MTSTTSLQEDKSFKGRLEQHPLVVVVLIIVGTVAATAAGMNWLNAEYIGKKHEAELATATSQYESRIRDLEDKIRDMEADARKNKLEVKQPESIPSGSPMSLSKLKPAATPDISNRASMARASAFISKARSFYEKKQYAAAIDECDRALRIDPKNETARQLRAEIQNTMKILSPQ